MTPYSRGNNPSPIPGESAHSHHAAVSEPGLNKYITMVTWYHWDGILCAVSMGGAPVRGIVIHTYKHSTGRYSTRRMTPA